MIGTYCGGSPVESQPGKEKKPHNEQLIRWLNLGKLLNCLVSVIQTAWRHLEGVGCATNSSGMQSKLLRSPLKWWGSGVGAQATDNTQKGVYWRGYTAENEGVASDPAVFKRYCLKP